MQGLQNYIAGFSTFELNYWILGDREKDLLHFAYIIDETLPRPRKLNPSHFQGEKKQNSCKVAPLVC